MKLCKYCGEEIRWNQKGGYFEEVREYGPNKGTGLADIITSKHDCRKNKRDAEQIRETIKRLQNQLEQLEGDDPL